MSDVKTKSRKLLEDLKKISKKMDEQQNMALKLAWFRKEEEKELQELSKPIDFDACKIDCQKLKVKKNIDKGAYGSVYQGMYDDKKVAVKVFHVSAVEEDSKFELRKSFLQEVCLSKDLDHPNIAKGYLHSKQIMHRDLKTANMLLDKNGRVKIIDFGISRFDDLNEKTQDIGTIGYIAPEKMTPEIPQNCPKALADLMKNCWDDPKRRPGK
ncbi:hypothetical protein Leryth_018680 [Lithospermum erythrorhizon]|nr:hypothetical protein Leryth_018680 [Lithospermum erythrorhizon]